MYKGAVQGSWWSRGGGWGPLARTFIDVVVGECDLTEHVTESARRAATFKILRAIGIDLMHKSIEELRREQQPMVDFANGVV